MRSSQLFLILAYLACCSVGYDDWFTHGKVWSRDFGGKRAANFTGKQKILVFVYSDALVGNCQTVRAKVNGDYHSHCIPLIFPVTGSNKTVMVCHRLYDSCRCITITPVESEWLDVELRPDDPPAKKFRCGDDDDLYWPDSIL